MLGRLFVPITLSSLLCIGACGSPVEQSQLPDGQSSPAGEDTSKSPNSPGETNVSKPTEPEDEDEDLRTCSPAADLIDKSLCVCKDFVDIGELIAGSVGVVGTTEIANHTDVHGSWTGLGAMTIIGDLVADEDVKTGDSATVLGRLGAQRDLLVTNDLKGIGILSVDQALELGGRDRFVGDRSIGSRRPFSNAPASPCGCERFDVAQAVVDASQRLNPTDLNVVGSQSVTLSAGEYYVEGWKTLGKKKLVIDGWVEIYLAGDIDTLGRDQLELLPGAELDLYVAGAIHQLGWIDTGSSDPSALRLYVGGADPVVLSVGDYDFSGALFAPTAAVQYIGYTKINGAILVGELVGTGKLDINEVLPEAAPEGTCVPRDDVLPVDPSQL